MKNYATIATLLLVGGCSTNGGKMIEACEAYIKGTLRSPSTYEQVRVDLRPHIAGSGTRIVAVEYDAANAYGTPVRENVECPVPVDPDTGRVDPNASTKAIASVIEANIILSRVKALTMGDPGP